MSITHAITLFFGVTSLVCSLPVCADSQSTKPNIVLILADDLGYADIGVYQGKNDTPNLNALAAEGIVLTDFYVPSPVCSASRASLLTGSYNSRVSIFGSLSPKSTTGLNLSETTLAEILKTNGYATALIGKWHLGHHPDSSPVNHGFDYFFGLPYSNDMSSDPEINPRNHDRHSPLPLMNNTEVIETEPDQRHLTRRYTEKAIEFVQQHKNSPFFLYFAHTAPHVPLYASERFSSASPNDLYGAVISEIDWSVGKILEAIEASRIEQDTLVIFTSDNGPWRVYGNHAGECGPLRGNKGSVWECGVRVPFIAKWTDKIPEGEISAAVASTIDILPTIARLAGVDSSELAIDGTDISPILLRNESPQGYPEPLYFYNGKNELQAMRWGKWKLHFPHKYRFVAKEGKNGRRGRYEQSETTTELYDLNEDIAESSNVASLYPDIVVTMQRLAQFQRQKLGDSLANVTGSERRDAGKYYDHWYQEIYEDIGRGLGGLRE